MTLYHGADASRPGAVLPSNVQILAAYVGIPGKYGPDTPHIWSGTEWNEYISEQPSLRVLPIYTHNFPGDPANDALDAVDAIKSLGWAAHLEGDQNRILAVDLEILVDPAYVNPLFNTIKTSGFSPMPYGSDAFVRQNPSGIGYWSALLMSHAPSVLPPGTRGIQWQWGNTWDLNVFDERVYLGCGRGLRRT